MKPIKLVKGLDDQLENVVHLYLDNYFHIEG